MIGESFKSDNTEMKSHSADSYRDIRPNKEMSVKERYDSIETEYNKAIQEYSATEIQQENRDDSQTTSENDFNSEKTVYDRGIDEVRDKSSLSSEVENNRPQETVLYDGTRESFDDDGKKYREDSKLLPNIVYTLKEYIYKTDGLGRIISAEGKVRMANEENPRNMEDVKKYANQDYRETDDRGHLIAHQFDGSDRLENLVPMDKDLNRAQGDFYKIETKLSDAVKQGDDVRLKVEPKYTDDSNRPSSFRVTYTINGEKTSVILKNGNGGIN